MQNQRPFNNLFAGFADEERDLTVDDEASLSGGEELSTSAAREPRRENDADVLLGQMAELRARFEAAQQDVVSELKHLRSENRRLTEENARWKAMVKEYKQILNGD